MMIDNLFMIEDDTIFEDMAFFVIYILYYSFLCHILICHNLSPFQTENIVLMGEFPNCDIKLCDLEVARVIQQGETITEWVGTLDYMGKYMYCNSLFFYIDIV